jgi:hypothetical protein
MSLIASVYFIGIALYISSLAAFVFKKKIRSEKITLLLLRTHFVLLAITLCLAILWSFKIHLTFPVGELIPFWLTLLSAILISGFSNLKSFALKFYFGCIFITHLFFSIVIVIPFIGIGLIMLVYHPFFPPDPADYETDKFRIQEESIGFMAPKDGPAIYFKCGLYELKRKPELEPMYDLDSVVLEKIDEKNVRLKFYSPDDNTLRIQTVTVSCGCL